MNLRGSMKPLPKVRRTIIIEYFKHILSSVGLRKRMMSCSPRGLYSPVTHVFFCFASIVMFVSRSCLTFSIIPRLIHLRRCHCIRLKSRGKGCFNVSPHQEGPFSGCYLVTSLEWPWIEWHQ